MIISQSAFLREKSLEGYSVEAVLEFMLKTAGVRSNIPNLIHSLLDAFGSYKGIMEARPSQLLKVKGVTDKTATLISLIVPMARMWEQVSMEDAQKLSSPSAAAQYCKSLLMGERNEQVYVVCLNAQCKLTGTRKITEGTINETQMYPRSIIETAIAYNARNIILCHNHPGGTCAPSKEDIACTSMLHSALKLVGTDLVDHIIVAASKTYSMAEHGDIARFCE